MTRTDSRDLVVIPATLELKSSAGRLLMNRASPPESELGIGVL